LPAILVATVLAIASGPNARAQDVNEQTLEQGDLGPEKPLKGWDFTVGGGIGIEPKYEGGKRYHIQPIPFVSIRYDNLLTVGAEGVSLNLLGAGRFQAGPVIGYQSGRNESDDTSLHGLGNVPAAVTAGAFAAYELGSFEFKGTARQAVSRTKNGFLGAVEASYKIRLIPQTLMLAVGPVVEFVDGNYNQTYFGVTPQQSARSGLRVFTPGAGVKDVGINLSLTYRLTDHVLFRGFASLKELVGDSADSPIVKQKTEEIVGIGAAYHF
jgi:outer membrane scaffolding protein for murein synthesis (MipA/OmpV family)